MKELIILMLFIVGTCAWSWALTIGIIYLICLCFSWEFNFLIATGIWLVILILKGIFSGRSDK